MNFTYFKFLFINTIKRKPVWITWLLFLFTCICFIIILPLAAKMNTLQVWANTTMAICQTFLGMTVALFTAILAINIFKEGNEEGTDLIIVSKPISRIKIVLTKFVLFGVFCLAVNASAVLITMFTAFLPRTEVRFYWGLVASMAIGNAVTFAVFGSLAILMSVNFAKVGIIISNVVISLIFLIYQALTIFCFPIPSKALADSKVAAPSYILVDRQADGSYKETEVVKFTVGNIGDIAEGKKIDCQAKNWQEMKEFWENNIMAKNPTPAINATDWAGQISLTYLSYGIDKYAYRQAQRMFALSRFYNCELTSPASPEIIGGVENKQTLPWLYTGYSVIPLSESVEIYLPSSFGFAGIKPITATRLRGYTDQIPVGYVRSKEAMSQREVYFEKEDFNTYKKPFDIMYDRVFEYSRYGTPTSEDTTTWDSFFAANNNNVKKYYEIIWASFMGKDGSVFDKKGSSYEYDATSFKIKTPDDINDRFIQFKYYAYLKALNEQQTLLNSAPATEHQLYYNIALQALQSLTSDLNVKYSNWMVQAANDKCIVVEPNTQSVSYNLIENEWALAKAVDPSYDMAKISAKSIMAKTTAIFNVVCKTQEKYLFDSTVSPSRNAKYTGEAHMVEDYWVPYIVSLLAPTGQNLQYFFYKIHPVVEYWMYAVIW